MTAPRQKVVLAPCMGVGKVVANVTRRAAYLAKGACPEDTELLSIPALLAGSEEERELLKHPVVVVEGCVLRCASHVMKFMGVTPAAKIEVTQLIREKRLTPGKTRKELEETGKKLAEAVAERTADVLRDEPTLQNWQEPADLTELPCACHALEPKDEPLVSLGVKGENNSAAGDAPAAQGITFLPCQGLKRSGARIAQRAAYHLCEDEDKLLGKSQPLCISALAAGVAEDVHYYQDFPTVALNGCGMNCATKVAELYGIPAVRSINIAEIAPEYPGEQLSIGEDLTPEEAAVARQWAEKIYPEMKALQESSNWAPRNMNTHGVVNDPKGIEADFGYQKTAKGFDVPTKTPHPQPLSPKPGEGRLVPVASPS